MLRQTKSDMTTGLVLGKFNPLHKGHIGLIEFAKGKCDELIVLVCASDQETLPGPVRLQWVAESIKDIAGIRPVLINYSETDLPNSSVSSRVVSQVWAKKISEIIPRIDIIFSSEKYGEYLAEFLACRHESYDPQRIKFPVSATDLRTNLFESWRFLADSARPYFVRKICISGTESTGKSTLTQRLASHFQTSFVPEMAREIIETTDECTEMHLVQIATLHAQTINEKIKTANKILFVDTDLNITRSYSRYLFKKDLIVPGWIEQANQFDLYLYLDNDAPYIQDGTRLDKLRRDELDFYHQKQLSDKGINFILIDGNWDQRYRKAVSVVEDYLSKARNDNNIFRINLKVF